MCPTGTAGKGEFLEKLQVSPPWLTAALLSPRWGSGLPSLVGQPKVVGRTGGWAAFELTPLLSPQPGQICPFLPGGLGFSIGGGG